MAEFHALAAPDRFMVGTPMAQTPRHTLDELFLGSAADDADDGGQSYRNERLGERKALFVTTLSLSGGAAIRFLDATRGPGGA